MFGSHLSIAGGLVNALHRARSLRMDCVQVFTKNQRQWKQTILTDENRDLWLTQLRDMKWRSVDGTGRTVAHNSYLINLASPDHTLWNRSLALQRIELERCEILDIPFLVSHPGAHMGRARPAGVPHDLGATPSRAELAGLNRIVRALDRLHRELPGYQTITCLETTVGAGSTLGYDFAHLRHIRDSVARPERVGFCFDTCHVTAAGYDLSSDDKAAAVLDQWDAICGLEHLHVVHCNDSKGRIGSRTDRHAHIGEGFCGRSCFRAIVNHPLLADVPKILETPKEETPKGTHYDILNLRRLKRLIEPPPGSR